MFRTESNVREKLLKAGAIARDAREKGIELSEPGRSIYDVVVEVEEYIVRKGGRPAFPVNIGIDSVAAHYTPPSGDTQKFPARGVLKFDVGVEVDGYVADTAASKSFGGSMQSLVDASRNALESALTLVRPGASLAMIGTTIENVISGSGYRPISNLMGHSIERYNLHAGFSVYNVKKTDDRTTIPQEIVIAVEPFATDGAGFVVSGRLGNIFSLSREKKLDDPGLQHFQETIRERYSTLPFAERWLTDVSDWRKKLNKLLRLGILHGYEMLIEGKGGTVSQWEHTLIVSGDGVVRTTA